MGVDLSKQNIWVADGNEVGENLFIDTYYKNANPAISNNSTNWSISFRRYNGSAAIHNIKDGIDTITLSAKGNLGICFCRKAIDINLDSNSYYTISCKAKCTKITHLDIGLSYYNNSNAWVWRGGTGAQNFNEVDTWQYFVRTFKPDTDTQYIMYCFTVVGTSGGTDTFSIKQCKLEKGSTPTPWLPNPVDNIYISSTVPFTENNNNNQLYIGNSWINANQFYQI